MTSPADIRELERRSERYWAFDGIPFLVWGGVWMLWGMALVLDDALQRTWWAALAFLAIAAVADRSIVVLKRRITYPRTGWVEPHGWAWSLPADLAWAVGGTIVVNILPDPSTSGSVLPWSVLFAAGFGMSAVRQRAPHLFVASGLVLVGGLVLAALGRGMAWACVTAGIAMAALGAWRLSRYLRLYPVQQA